MTPFRKLRMETKLSKLIVLFPVVHLEKLPDLYLRLFLQPGYQVLTKDLSLFRQSKILLDFKSIAPLSSGVSAFENFLAKFIRLILKFLLILSFILNKLNSDHNENLYRYFWLELSGLADPFLSAGAKISELA